ncbi:ATP-dependent nuclease [Priestia flexa]|uniref:ATP-dependent nuclease n=1 Tax=Priestia flexa TaxID=86664 RepID=UPI0039B49615
MYLEKISLYNFRQFGIQEDGSPSMTVYLNPRFNLVVGENDAGKTAIIDGIRYLLGSVSDDFEKISQEDFYSPNKDIYSDYFFIEGMFTNLSDKEAGAFLEWLSFDDENNYILRLILKVEKRKNENGVEYIDKKLLAGEATCEGRLDSAARNLLKTTYLKPLRDAGAELKSGFRSRLVHILKAHPAFKNNEEQTHKLVEVMKEANEEIEKYFESEYIEGHSLISDIENLLSSFYDTSDQSKSKAKFTVTNSDLLSILRKLSLNNEDINLGLGNLNLLFIATELLLLNNYADYAEIVGPKITLIEEIEAHLHTQAQIRLIKFLESELNKKGNESQFILTSHSPNLVASIDPKNIIFIQKQNAYPMSEQYTLLKQEDYKFLERFLDSTKSNLFFAKGIILVEGESEMLLLPALANLIGYPLHQFGISIVNIRGTSFERYIKLFSRSSLWIEEMELPILDIPVSIVTDVDIKPYIYYEFEEKEKPFFSIEDEAKLDEILPHINVLKENLKMDYIGFEYSTLRKLAKDFGFKISEENEDVLTSLIEKEITEDYIVSVDKSKREEMINKYESYNCNLNLSIAPQWTLEFSLALSVLAKLLYRSIHLNRYQNPFSKSNKREYYDLVKEIEKDNLNEIEKMKVAYKIFKPVNDGLVSKAEVAQTLAIYTENLIKEYPTQAEKLKHNILDDKNLKYLVEAILHAASATQIREEVLVGE